MTRVRWPAGPIGDRSPSSQRGGDRQRSAGVVEVSWSEVAIEGRPPAPDRVGPQEPAPEGQDGPQREAGEAPARGAIAPLGCWRSLGRGGRRRRRRGLAPSDRSPRTGSRVATERHLAELLALRQAGRRDRGDLELVAERGERSRDPERPRVGSCGSADEDDGPGTLSAGHHGRSAGPTAGGPLTTGGRSADRTRPGGSRAASPSCIGRARHWSPGPAPPHSRRGRVRGASGSPLRRRRRRSDRRRTPQPVSSDDRGHPRQVGCDDGGTGGHRLEELVRGREAVVEGRRLDGHRDDIGRRDPVDAGPAVWTAGRRWSRPPSSCVAAWRSISSRAAP